MSYFAIVPAKAGTIDKILRTSLTFHKAFCLPAGSD